MARNYDIETSFKILGPRSLCLRPLFLERYDLLTFSDLDDLAIVGISRMCA